MTVNSYQGVDLDVTFEPSWLTWVSATTGCLRHLGVDCDLIDVAGFSGYAFLISVSTDLCPSGPTAFDWGRLALGPRCLGRSTLTLHTSGPWACGQDESSGESDATFAAAFELARTELAQGRPCVIWGTYVPEFGIAVGTQEKSYRVSSFKTFLRQAQPPIAYDELNAPGGPYVLAFPTALPVTQDQADRAAVNHAVEMMHGRIADGLATGREAYSTWIAALESDRGNAFGNSYNAQCWAEARRFAAAFLDRLAGRHDQTPALRRAADQMLTCATRLQAVKNLFPFPGQPDHLNADACQKARDALSQAAEAETLALDALADAAQLLPAVRQ